MTRSLLGVIVGGTCKNLAEWADTDPLIDLSDRRQNMFYSLAKRALDLIVSISCLAVTWPFLLAIVIALKGFGCPWTLIRERRIGRNGQPFFSYRLHAGGGPPESRVAAPLQNLLRVTGAGYLPELLNVLRGHMSLVGPASLDARISNRRLSVQPGMIHFQPDYVSEVRNEDLARLDAFYVQHRSFLLDLQILYNFLCPRFKFLIRTVPGAQG